MSIWVIAIAAFVGLVVLTILFLASRYKRCPSDKILVLYGKVGAGQSARCIRGGGSFILPLVQDYSYMSLTPMTISIPLQKALSLQNIRINVPSTFTVGISTEPERLNAEEVVKQEIAKRKIEIAAEAKAESIRREAKGEADAILLKYEAEARGLKQVLESKASGYLALINSCNGDACSVATLLLTEKLEHIVNMQVEAIKNLKIDKITVWDSGGGDGFLYFTFSFKYDKEPPAASRRS